jgi:ATP-dependent Clp protease ATP-binding subunit ClpA
MNPTKPRAAQLVAASLEHRILTIRGRSVMIDADLADLYGVQTRVLNQAVRRNKERFPAEFMFQLTSAEKQEVITGCDHLARLKFSPALPYAFTEHGTLMLGNVLNSERAIEVSLLVVRTFVSIREMLASHKDLAAKLNELEGRVGGHDEAIADLIDAIRRLAAPPVRKSRPIGFAADLEGKKR